MCRWQHRRTGFFYLGILRLGIIRLDIIIDSTMVQPTPDDIASTLSLSQNYPNPFNPGTVIEYTLPEAVVVNLSIYDIQGKWIVTLENGLRSSGLNSSTWDGRDAGGNAVSTGVYFYRLKAGDQLVARKMVRLK